MPRSAKQTYRIHTHYRIAFIVLKHKQSWAPINAGLFGFQMVKLSLLVAPPSTFRIFQELLYRRLLLIYIVAVPYEILGVHKIKSCNLNFVTRFWSFLFRGLMCPPTPCLVLYLNLNHFLCVCLHIFLKL